MSTENEASPEAVTEPEMPPQPVSSSGPGNNNAQLNNGPLVAVADNPTNDLETSSSPPRVVTSGEKIAVVQEVLLPFEIPTPGSIKDKVIAQISTGLAAAAITPTSSDGTMSVPGNLPGSLPYGSGSDGDAEEGEFDENPHPDDNSTLSYAETLEEGTLRHMNNSGFLAQLKGEIAKYMFDITKASLLSTVVPDRANKELLTDIYDYLIWVGMKASAAVLVSEAPMPLKEEVPGEPSSKKSSKTKIGGGGSMSKKDKPVPKLATLFGFGVPKETETKREETKEESGADKPEKKDSFQEISKKTSSNTKELGQEPPEETRVVSKEDVSLIPKPEVVPGHKEEKVLTPTTSKTKIDLESTPPPMNKQLSKPHLTTHSGDLLTGSPLSSPAPSSAKVPSSLNLVPSKTESFDNLLQAYIGCEKESQNKIQKKSDTTMEPFLIPAPQSPPPVSPEDNLMAFTFTSTPIREPQRQPEATPPDATYSIEKLGAERSFFSKQSPNQEQEEEENTEESTSLSAPAAEAGSEGNKEFEIDTESPLAKKSEQDNSTSDALSVELEECENDNTLDISLPSDAKGTSDCDHVVNLKE